MGVSSTLEFILCISLAGLICSAWIYHENPEILHHPAVETISGIVSQIVPASIRKRFTPSTKITSLIDSDYEFTEETVRVYAFSAGLVALAYVILWTCCRKTKDSGQEEPRIFYEEEDVYTDDSEEDQQGSRGRQLSQLEQHVRRIGRRSFQEPPPQRVVTCQRAFSLDCEMCDVEDAKSEKVFKFPIKVVIMNEDLEVEYSQYICPGSRLMIIDDLSRIHGITEGVFRKHGISLLQVQRDIMELMEGHILTGHDLQHDLKALNLRHYFLEDHIFDTANARLFMVRHRNGFRPKRLTQLAWEHLGIKMRSDGTHDPVEDAMVSMQLYRKYRHLDWIKPTI